MTTNPTISNFYSTIVVSNQCRHSSDQEQKNTMLQSARVQAFEGEATGPLMQASKLWAGRTVAILVIRRSVLCFVAHPKKNSLIDPGGPLLSTRTSQTRTSFRTVLPIHPSSIPVFQVQRRPFLHREGRAVSHDGPGECGGARGARGWAWCHGESADGR